MSFWDILAGWASIGTTMFIDAIFNKFKFGVKGSSKSAANISDKNFVKELLDDTWESPGRRALKHLREKLGLTPSEVCKNLVSDVTGFCIGHIPEQDDSSKVWHAGHSLFGVEVHADEPFSDEGGVFRGTGPLFGS
jgi:hypothetical protein